MEQSKDKVLEKLRKAQENQNVWEELVGLSLIDGLKLVKDELSHLNEEIDLSKQPFLSRYYQLFIKSLEICIDKSDTLDSDILSFFLSEALSNSLSYFSHVLHTEDNETLYVERRVYLIPLMDLAEVKEDDVSQDLHVLVDPAQAIPFPDEVGSQSQTEDSTPASSVPAMLSQVENKKIPPKIEEVVQSETYLLFSNLGQSFALPVKYVTEIIEEQELNPLPGNHQHLLGILNLRGRPVAVTRFFQEEHGLSNQSQKRHVIIVEYQNISTGFIVDEAEGIADFKLQDLQDTNTMYGAGLTKEVDSIVKFQDRNTFVLNLEELLGQEYAKHG